MTLTKHMDDQSALWWLIMQTRRAMARAREKELARFNVTPEEASVLFCCQALGRRATPAEISRWLLREPHSVSSLVTRMEKKKFVRKIQDEDRKNGVRVVPTQKGKDAYNASAEDTTTDNTIHRIMSIITKEDSKRLRVILSILRDQAFEELGVTKKPPTP